MLSNATPFPQQGSYCLYEDPNVDPVDRHPHLARIIRWDGDACLISLPLREGAGGNLTVPGKALKDATALTMEEQREMIDADRQTRGRDISRSKRLKALRARHDELKARLIWSGCLQRKLDRLNQQQRSQGLAA